MRTQTREKPGALTIRLRDKLHGFRQDDDELRFVLSDRPDVDEATSMQVEQTDDGTPVAVEIRRGAHSYFPVYFRVCDDGTLIVADTMAFLHDVVAEERLSALQDAQRDQLVFGRPASTGLVSGVEVVDHGERVVIERDGGRWSIEVRERYDRFSQGGDRYWREGLDRFESCLEQSAQSISPRAVLFSGGVDSSLVQSLLGGDAEMITARIPGEQFAPEVERARWASKMFGARHRIVDVDHYDYLTRLVEITRLTGLPCPAMQHVLQTAAAAGASQAACYGELGDGTFGFPIIDRQLRQWFQSVDHDSAAAATRRFSVASIRDDDHCFDDGIEAVYGPVQQAHRRRSGRLRHLADWSPQLQGEDNGWERFLTYGHITDFITVGCIKFVRDFASCCNVVLHTPLMDRAAIDCFHRFDPATRYRDDGEMKPALKAVLSKRVPDYQVDRPKLASGLPRSWYFTEGPLAHAFERYPPPEPMSRAVARAVEQPQWHNSWILWPTLSYSVWYHEWLQASEVPTRQDMVVYGRSSSGRGGDFGVEQIPVIPGGD